MRDCEHQRSGGSCTGTETAKGGWGTRTGAEDVPWVGGFQLGLKDEARRDYGEKGNGGQGREQVKSSGRGWRGGERGWRKVGSLVLSPAGVSAGCRGQGVHGAEAGADRTAGSALTPGGGGRGRQELPAWYRGVWCPLLDPLKKLAAPRSLLCAEPPLPKRLVRF